MSEDPVPVRCPTCEPEQADSGELVEWRFCEAHAPSPAGADDARVDTSTYLNAASEAGGAENRMMCALLHGPARQRRSKP